MATWQEIPPGVHMPRILCRAVIPHREEELANMFFLEYLAEGAANIVFRVKPSPSINAHGFVFETQLGSGNFTVLTRAQLDRKVLRMSKGKPKTLRYKEIMEGFEYEVLPLFRKSEAEEPQPKQDLDYPPQSNTPADVHASDRERMDLSITESFEDFVMDHIGVGLSQEVKEALLAELYFFCPHNQDIRLNDLESQGILLPDMSAHDRKAVMLELKPKWLVQSPNAPRDAYLCRTCALQASREVWKKNKPWICPLALAAGNTQAIESWVHQAMAVEANSKYTTRHHLLPIRTWTFTFPQPDAVTNTPADQCLTSAASAKIIARALPYLTTGPGHKLLRHLTYLQRKLDDKGITSGRLNPHDVYRLRLAMTLRDCSLFIRIPYSSNVPIEAKLGDLDFKSLDKMNDWHTKEQTLINERWYLDPNHGMHGCWIAQGWQMYVPWYY